MTTLAEADRALLQRFAPVLRYTRGERFFPMDVARYLSACSLWQQAQEAEPEQLLAEGHVTPEQLAVPRPADFGAAQFLKFIEPLNIAELANYAVQTGLLTRPDPLKVFAPGRGRLSRVGYGSRFVDALFSLTLLARGRVPGDTAAAAIIAYEQIQRAAEHYQYYGRVVRREGWIVLQYYFFYAFNNWRSGFFGANDHEADWEMICIYLANGPKGEAQPEWVAYASHDFSGDDLRRHWHDPEVRKVGEHPVVYAGAGSHASYFENGEYLTEIELPFLSPLVKFMDRAQELGRRWFGQRAGSGPAFNAFRIPFVDYARGDGLVIGPGGQKAWAEPVLLDTAPWATEYRGLWGLYAQDPVAGENAPAGPVYNRDGSVRHSWYDPLGWAGLDKVPPTPRLLERLHNRRAELEVERAQRAKQIGERGQALVELGLDAEAARQHPHLAHLAHQSQDKITKLAREVRQLRAQQTETEALLEAYTERLARVARGEPENLRAHLRREIHPEPPMPTNRLTEWWAALSIGLMLLGFVVLSALVRFDRLSFTALLGGMAGLVTLVVFLEAWFRKQLHRLIPNVTVLLAVICGVILVYNLFTYLLIGGVLFAGGYILWENIRELAER
jgi:hypothetical protein